MTAKDQLRRRMKRLRSSLSTEAVRGLSTRVTDRVLALPEVTEATGVLVYASFRKEVHTHALIDALRDLGKQVAVPRMVHDAIEPRLVTDRQLEPGALGIPTSDGPVATRIDVCLTPGLAFSLRGHRLGFGRGHYDRFFASNPGALPIGLCFEFQLVDRVPADDWDRPMSMVATPDRVVRCGSSRPPR